MAMLAEKRSKQKWSEDPRNITWSNDKGRYGYQMLEKMGWADGKGLGSKQGGNTAHVKIKKRKQNLGLGAKETHDQDWMAQQEDFSNLLSALQQHGGNAELKTEEQNKNAMLEVAKASRKRVFYKKFIRSKDTSQYSKNDLACIFGKTASHSNSAPTTPPNQSDEEARSEDSSTSCPTTPQNTTADTSFVTYTSKHNIHEYFARRMKTLRDGNAGNKEDDDGHQKDCEVPDRASPCSGKKDKKKKAKKKRKEAEDECIEVDAPKKRKKRKKMKTCEVNEGNAEECLTNEGKCANVEDTSGEILGGCNSELDDKPKRKKSKKKKKSRNDSLGC